MQHKAGFVNIIGLPNVGKSTLMNLLVGEQLSIITYKAQTTRHRILGIVNKEHYQIIFSDTPGLVKDTANKMHEQMNEFVFTAFKDADVFLFITELNKAINDHKTIIEKLKNHSTPTLLLINKIDLAKDQKNVENYLAKWEKELPNAKIILISALNNLGTDAILNEIVERLPESPPYYSKDALTDKPERFFVSEKIREKIFLHYKQEIPYSTEVEVMNFKEENKIIRIEAEIYVERDSQKNIIIGKGGQSIKIIGTEARKDLESFFQKKIFLQLFVKVKDKWRDNEYMLKKFGYKQ